MITETWLHLIGWAYVCSGHLLPTYEEAILWAKEPIQQSRFPQSSFTLHCFARKVFFFCRRFCVIFCNLSEETSNNNRAQSGYSTDVFSTITNLHTVIKTQLKIWIWNRTKRHPIPKTKSCEICSSVHSRFIDKQYEIAITKVTFRDKQKSKVLRKKRSKERERQKVINKVRKDK